VYVATWINAPEVPKEYRTRFPFEIIPTFTLSLQVIYPTRLLWWIMLVPLALFGFLVIYSIPARGPDQWPLVMVLLD